MGGRRTYKTLAMNADVDVNLTSTQALLQLLTQKSHAHCYNYSLRSHTCTATIIHSEVTHALLQLLTQKSHAHCYNYSEVTHPLLQLLTQRLHAHCYNYSLRSHTRTAAITHSEVTRAFAAITHSEDTCALLQLRTQKSHAP